MVSKSDTRKPRIIQHLSPNEGSVLTHLRDPKILHHLGQRAGPLNVVPLRLTGRTRVIWRSEKKDRDKVLSKNYLYTASVRIFQSNGPSYSESAKAYWPRRWAPLPSWACGCKWHTQHDTLSNFAQNVRADRFGIVQVLHHPPFLAVEAPFVPEISDLLLSPTHTIPSPRALNTTAPGEVKVLSIPVSSSPSSVNPRPGRKTENLRLNLQQHLVS